MNNGYINEGRFFEKDPMNMTEEEAKIAVAYWRARYEATWEMMMIKKEYIEEK